MHTLTVSGYTKYKIPHKPAMTDFKAFFTKPHGAENKRQVEPSEAEGGLPKPYISYEMVKSIKNNMQKQCHKVMRSPNIYKILMNII
jgi:hypothetical protein